MVARASQKPNTQVAFSVSRRQLYAFYVLSSRRILPTRTRMRSLNLLILQLFIFYLYTKILM